MADKIKKFLAKLPNDQLIFLLPYLRAIKANNIEGMNTKQLKGHKGIYRARIGKYRVVFRPVNTTQTEILLIGKRDDQTYRDF